MSDGHAGHAAGWRVIIHYHASAEAAAATVATIRTGGGEAFAVQADLADRAAVARLIPACTERFGAISLLVNNASHFRHDDIATLDEASWDAHLASNLAAPVFLSQAFARALDGAGAIVNMLDHKLACLNPDFFSYTVAKAGLAAATQMLAMAFRGRIRVNGIAPGITLISGRQTQPGFERAWAAPPLGRSSTPGELAAALRFILATPSLNGQTLCLDGGESLRPRRRDVSFEIA